MNSAELIVVPPRIEWAPSRLREFAFYAQELRPVALDHYRSGESKIAMKDYEVLLDLDKNDLDAHFHLSLIFAGMGRWPDAEHHFGRANELRPRAPWILQAFGKAKLRAGKIAEGEALLLEAEKSNRNHSPTLVELGRLREKQNVLDEAEAYYRRAIAADSNNSYAYYLYGRLLYRQGEIKQAYDMAKAALVSNPLNARNKALVQEMKDKVLELGKAEKQQSPTLVRVKCVERSDSGTSNGYVQSIGGVNSNGKPWKTKSIEAISFIEQRRYRFFIETPEGQKTDLIVAVDGTGHKYLKTAGDKGEPLSLLSLPPCPRQE